MQLSNRPSNNPNSNTEEIKLGNLEQNTFTQEEIEEYKEVLLNREQAERVRQGRITIEEISRLAREQLKLNMESERSVEQSQLRGREINRQGNESQEIDREDADSTLSSLNETVQSAGQQVRERASEIKENIAKVEGASGILNWLEQAKEKGGIMGFFASIILGITGMLGLNKANKAISEAEQATEQTKNKLKTISNDFVKTTESNFQELGVSITPENKKELESFITNPENFSEEELNAIYKAIKEGKINKLSDLKNYLNGGANNLTYKKLNKIIFDKEQREVIKNASIHKVQQSIENEFGIKVGDLKAEQKQKLNELIRKNGVSEDFIQVAERYENNEFISFSELIKTGLIAVPHMALFTFELFRIIPAEGIVKYFMLSITNLFELSREKGGDLQDTLLSKLEQLSPEEKNLVFGVAMRKGMFAMNVIDNLTFIATRTIIESVSHEHGNFINNAKIFGGSNYLEQKNLFDRFNDSLGKSQDINTKYIKERMENLHSMNSKASNISEILDGIKSGKVNNNIKQYLESLTNNNIAKEILKSSPSTIEDLKRLVSSEIGAVKGNLNKLHGKGLSSGKDIFNKGGFGIDSELNNLLKTQEKRLTVFLEEWERSIGQNGGNLKFWKKYSAIRESLRYSHDMKNIEIHVNSLQSGAKQLDHLKAMQIESPKLFGSLFGTIATGLIIKAGIETKDDNTGTLEHMWNIGKYLIPTFGPIQVLTNESGIQKADTLRNSIKFGAESASMGILLTMDAAYISQALISHGFSKESFVKILKYHGQVVTTPIEFAKALNYQRMKYSEFSKSGGKLLDYIKTKPSAAAKVAKQMIKSKNAWLMLTAVGLMGVSYFTESSETKAINELKEKGLINEKGEPIFENIDNNISKEDKEFILEYLVWGNIKDIDVKFEGDKTLVYTSDKEANIIDLLFPQGKSIVYLLEDLGVNTDSDYLKIIKTA